MKIIIVGAGRIGTNLAKSLADENNEIYLIERNEDVARKAMEKLDVKVITGNGSDPDVLKRAQVVDAELVLALTTSDETNLVVCALAALFGAKRRLARVRNTALSTTLEEFGYRQFSIDEIINPELVAAEAIVNIIQSPGSNEVADFAQGKILLRGFDIPEGSPLCQYQIGDLREEDFPWPFLIVSIVRNRTVIIPKGDTHIEAGDLIYVLLPQPSLAEFLTFVNPQVTMPTKVVIYGATMTGQHVAAALAQKVRDIIIIEEDENLAAEVAGKLTSVRVIHGSASETDILTECGIEAADVFIATSDNDHSNLISSVLAKDKGAKRTIIMTQQPDYMSIVNALDIDAIINPHYLAVKQILHLVRGEGIQAVTKLLECDAEAIELVPQAGSAVTKDKISRLKFPKNAIIGAIDTGSEVVLANGDTQIQEGQKVIVFCHGSAVAKMQSFFMNKHLL